MSAREEVLGRIRTALGVRTAVPAVVPLYVGWSTIYTTPSWMTDTQN